MRMDVCGRWAFARTTWAKSTHSPNEGTTHWAAWWALTGAYREYIEITHEYPLAAANAFATLHPELPFVFLYVSGEGATQSPGMLTTFFGSVKGRAESALFNLSKQHAMFRVYNVRAGGVDWTHHPEIQPFIPTQPLWKKLLVPVLNVVYQGIMTPTGPMSEVMVRLVMSNGEELEGSGIGMEGTLVKNEALRRMGGL
jgi:hypothetical protein